MREGTPISSGHPNDFPSPRRGAEDVPKAPKKKHGPFDKSEEDVDDAKAENKYYAAMPYLNDIPSSYNPVIDKIHKTNKNFIHQIWHGNRRLPEL